MFGGTVKIFSPSWVAWVLHLCNSCANKNFTPMGVVWILHLCNSRASKNFTSIITCRIYWRTSKHLVCLG